MQGAQRNLYSRCTIHLLNHLSQKQRFYYAIVQKISTLTLTKEVFFLFIFSIQFFKIYSREQNQETWSHIDIEQKILEGIQFNQLVLSK